MNRTRAIAAAPVRTASEAWQAVTSLISDTVERSSAVPEGTVAAEIAALGGMGPALVAGGHLEQSGAVLVDEGLHLTIRVLTGDAALKVDENLNPVPGGSNATEGWVLYLPCPEPFSAALSDAVESSDHLSIKEPPSSAPTPKRESATAGGVLDLEAIRRQGDRA